MIECWRKRRGFPNFLLFLLFMVGFPWAVRAQEEQEEKPTSSAASHYVHSLTVEGRYSRILPNLPFYAGENMARKPIENVFSGHLKYSFRLPAGSIERQIYADTYQGVGLARFDFGNGQELGNPIALYLFQGARIAQLSNRISLDYEWNFGLSSGWKAHDFETNPYNVGMGSRMNAYINIGLLMRMQLNSRLDMTLGGDITHFSNGNTVFPNAGLNMAGAKLGLLYHLNPEEVGQKVALRAIPPFPKHMSYDMVFFGAWRSKGVQFFDKLVPSPVTYPVVGAYFAPMYNFSYRFRAGVSIDGLYDGSANVYTKDYIVGTKQEFFKPPLNKQFAMGFSARGEYVMPLFSIGMGIGANAIHGGGDFKGTYQTFALKIGVTPSSFLHVGYNLKDFHEPNFLMLGLGFRLNNQRPSWYK